MRISIDHGPATTLQDGSAAVIESSGTSITSLARVRHTMCPSDCSIKKMSTCGSTGFGEGLPTCRPSGSSNALEKTWLLSSPYLLKVCKSSIDKPSGAPFSAQDCSNDPTF